MRVFRAAVATVLGIVSVLAILSFSGQIFIAPLLLPVQWAAARFLKLGRLFFIVLASLLVTEIGLLVGYEILGSGVAAIPVGLACGLATAALFARTTTDELGVAH
jgi:hypothetical protein